MKQHEYWMKRTMMANLQVKGIDDDFYEDLKRLAAAENRSVSQQVLLILREFMAKKVAFRRTKMPAEVLLDLAGSWQDERTAEELAADIRAARKSSAKLRDGL
jgi:plasmid stability protein